MIQNGEVTGKALDAEADSTNASLFRSLLMALAYALVTRCDVSVYVVALQRIARSLTYGHIKKLNTIVRWTQKHPLRLVYGKLQC